MPKFWQIPADINAPANTVVNKYFFIIKLWPVLMGDHLVRYKIHQAFTDIKVEVTTARILENE